MRNKINKTNRSTSYLQYMNDIKVLPPNKNQITELVKVRKFSRDMQMMLTLDFKKCPSIACKSGVRVSNSKQLREVLGNIIMF